MNYTKPELLSFPFGEKKLDLYSSLGLTRGAHHAAFDEEIAILLRPVGDRRPTDLGGDGIRALQNLLTFATDTPNAIEEISYYGPKDEQGFDREYHLLFDPIFRLQDDKRFLPSSDMLFTLRDALDLNLNIFEKWLDFSERNLAFCTVFFANLYSEPTYLNDQFTNLLLAFTLLTTTTKEVSERAKLFLRDVETALKSRFSDEDRDLLEPIIPTGAEIEMPYHLLSLLQENADLMRKVIDDIPSFVRLVCDTLSFFRRRSDWKRSHLEGRELLYASLKIRLLIKIVILKELGFSEEAVRSLILRNNKINFLRTV